MAVAGVEYGLIQALAVGAPGPCLSVCVIASLRRQGLQLAEVREGVYQQMDGRVVPEVVAASELAFREALEDISRAAEQHWRVDHGPDRYS